MEQPFALPDEEGPRGIGTLQENSLHAALKAWYAQPGDRLEENIDGYTIDIVRGDLLIEIQTRNFSAMKNKLLRLVERHPVRLVHPIAVEKWIVQEGEVGAGSGKRRKSPRRGQPVHLFTELVRIPHLVSHPNFSLEILLTRQEEIQSRTPLPGRRESWRRKGWNIVDRRLLEVIDTLELEEPADFLLFLPPELPLPFTTRELARSMKQPRYLAQKTVYCLRCIGLIEQVGLRGRSYLYALSSPHNSQVYSK